jgi:hypothetical protein
MLVDVLGAPSKRGINHAHLDFGGNGAHLPLRRARVRPRQKPEPLPADPVALARLWLLRDRLHRRRQLALIDEIDLDTAWLWSLRSRVNQLEFVADLADKKGNKERAKTLQRQAIAVRSRIRGLRAERAARWRVIEECDCEHDERQRALEKKIFGEAKA